AVAEPGIYAVDALVRRAGPLQETVDARDSSRLWLNPEDADARKLSAGDRVRMSGESGEREFVLACDPGVIQGSAWFPATCGMIPWQAVTLEAAVAEAEA
ncbi:MAG: hypothetical protein L0I62_07365, partial [Gammaproteobacteria bacterium]|nr:hypothetical protein [Gammaproteobacteria bacterium]